MRRYKGIRRSLKHGLIGLGVMSSGMAFGGGCNTEVRSVVLSGLNELSVALIDAFFVTLAEDNGTVPTASLNRDDPSGTRPRG